MEEEIITPEEEVFDYHTLRYILDKDGCVCHASLGGLIVCDLGECTEYKGDIPEGYETIEEWYDGEIERLNSWKIVDGNLVFDANRDYKLKIKCEQEHYENSHITRKELGMVSTEEIDPYKELFPNHQSSGGNIVSLSEEIDEVGNLPTEEVNLTVSEKQELDLIELEFIGNNFLPNTATSNTNNGITYTQNKDKTIDVNGTATDKSTLILAGTNTGVRNILTFKANKKYVLQGLEGLSLEFYHYDGSERTLIGTYNGGIISFEEDTNVTQVVLTVDSGITVDATIKPMIKLIGLEYPLLPMAEYTGEGERKGQYYVDGVSTQVTKKGKNKFNYAKASNVANTRVTEYRIFEIDGLEANTTYTLHNYENIANNTDTYIALWHQENYGGSMALFVAPNHFVSSATNTTQEDGKLYLAIAPTDEATWNRVISCFEIAQLEKGEITEYEPYGDVPSPERPSEITNTYKAGIYNAIAHNKLYTITLEEDLRSLPDGVADRLWIKPNSEIEIEKKVETTVLNGDYWYTIDSLNTDATMWFQSSIVLQEAKVINAINRSNLISNYFDTYNCYDLNSLSGICYHSDKKIQIRITKDLLNTQDEEGLKAWLSTHKVEVYYELDTYKITPTSSDENFVYEEYKNNTTIIDLAGNEIEIADKITIKDSQITLIKGNGEEIYLGEATMPKTYSPFTHAYCHQPIFIDFIYKNTKNVDVRKIALEGLVSVNENFKVLEDGSIEAKNGKFSGKIVIEGDRPDYSNNDFSDLHIKYHELVDGIEGFDGTDITYGSIETTNDVKLFSNGMFMQSKYNNSVAGSSGNTYGDDLTKTINIDLYDKYTPIRVNQKLGDETISSVEIDYNNISINGGLVSENITDIEIPTTTLVNEKRVYKKLYTGTMPSGTGTNLDLTPLNIDCDMAWIDQSLSYVCVNRTTVPTTYYYSDADYLRIWIEGDANSIKVRQGADLSSFSYHIVVAYTKVDGTVEPDAPDDVVDVENTKTIIGSTSSNLWAFKTVVVESSVNKDNRTSTITVENYLGRPSSVSSSYFMGTFTTTYNCGGKSYSETMYQSSGTIESGGWHKLGSHTFTITHTTEPMTINVGGSMSTSAFNPSSASASGTMTLTSI